MENVIYGFSGDPITNGHIDVIERAVKVFGKLTVGIGMNPAKKYFLSLEERRKLAAEALKHLPNVRVIDFRGLLVDFAYENGISTVIRGIRNSEDLNYELMLYQIGASQKLNIDTVFFPASQNLSHVSSGAVKALQLEQGFIHEYVPLCVKQKLEEKLSNQFLISITGTIGSGKSFISQKLKEIGLANGLEVHILDIDKIGHQILEELNEPIYQNVRKEIADRFGKSITRADGFIDRKALGQIIFRDKIKLDQFNFLLYKPLLLRLRREIYGKKGLIILDSALISESEMSYLSNNNIILLNASSEIQNQRLIARGYNSEQIQHRMNSQYTATLKREMIIENIAKHHWGKLWEIDNSQNYNEHDFESLFLEIIKYLNIKMPN